MILVYIYMISSYQSLITQSATSGAVITKYRYVDASGNSQDLGGLINSTANDGLQSNFTSLLTYVVGENGIPNYKSTLSVLVNGAVYDISNIKTRIIDLSNNIIGHQSTNISDPPTGLFSTLAKTPIINLDTNSNTTITSTFLSINQMIRLDGSISSLTLPDPNLCGGQRLFIYSNANNSVNISCVGSSKFINSNVMNALIINKNTIITLICDGNYWIVTS
jgi:hypothetical protein